MVGQAEATPAECARSHAWYRSYGLQVVLAGGLFGAAVLVAAVYDLPVRDPDDSVVGPVYIRLPLIALSCFLIDVLARCVRRGGLRGLRSTIPALVRERWPLDHVRLVLIGLGSWYLAYVGFRNLKSYVPFVRPQMMDGTLLRLDRDLAFGHDPAALLHALLGTGVTAHLMSFTYVAWILFLSLSLLVALFWTRNVTTACWYVTAVAVNWVLGVAVYYLVPSMGPVYARPALFAALPETQSTHIAQGWLADRVDMLAHPFATDALQTVAAFASLHVAVMVTASLIASMVRLQPAFVRWGLWLFLGLNILATVYLGWHYLLDVFGGTAIGFGAVWIAAYGTGNQHRLPHLVPSASGRHRLAGILRSQVLGRQPANRGLVVPERERFWTLPTTITVTRTLASVATVVVAVHQHSFALLLAGLAVYWVGDVLDGALARLLDRETRIGAVTDIVCDRLSAVFFYLGLLWLHLAAPVPLAVYLAEFTGADLLLSLAFLAGPLVSPNYFYLVDRPTWVLNWSPLAKGVNSAGFALILLGIRNPGLATVFAMGLLTVKAACLVRLRRLGLLVWVRARDRAGKAAHRGHPREGRRDVAAGDQSVVA